MPRNTETCLISRKWRFNLKLRGSGRGLALYVILIAAIFIVVFSVNNKNQKTDVYTYEQFVNDVKKDYVRSVVVKPYQETPTGALEVALSTGRVRTLYVADVPAIEKELKDLYPSYYEDKVEKDSLFLVYGLPVLMTVAALFIFMAKPDDEFREKPGKNVQCRGYKDNL